MDKYPPVVCKSSLLKLVKAETNEVIDPAFILSQDSGQQLGQGVDNGIILTGMVPKSAYPSTGDLCDLAVGTATKTALSLTKTYSNQTTGTFTASMSLPVASKTSAGLMTGDDKEALEALRTDVDALQGGGSRLDERYFTFDVFDSDPTVRAQQEAEITAYAIAEWGSSDLPDNLSVHNANGGHLFRFNKATGKWVDDGLDTVGVATDNAAGVVKGGDGTPGTITVAPDGEMSVAGWSGLEQIVNKASSFGATPNNTRYPTEKLLADSLAAKEDKANKTTSLTGSSTNDQYPSAKAVYDALAAKASAGDKTTTISSSSTDAQYPSAKAVYDALALKESLANKTSTLSASSTNDQYPGAKAVYDALALKEDKSNKVTSLSSSSTTTQYPSAKTVYDALALKENTSNKVTSFSSSSTDAQYPTAKAVYTAVNTINNSLTTINSSLSAADNKYAGSVVFAKSSETVYASLPAGVTSMWVESRWADVSSTMTLQIKAATSTGSATSVSTSSSAPTTISSLAGAAVAFTVSGMSSSAKSAVIGVRMS